MLESAAAAGMGGMGGLLGQLGDVLSAPRRFAWDALGLPEDGASLLSQTFGMDRESPWTKILGVGAEAALDPLTYAGMLAGGPLAKAATQFAAGRKTAAAGEEVAQLAAARRAAQEALVARAGGEAETVSRYADQAGQLAAHDVPSIAGGRTRTYNSFSEALADDMTNSGMGTVNGDGQLVTVGDKTPLDVKMGQRTMTDGTGRKAGSLMDHAGDGGTYKGMDPLLPDQLDWLKDTTAEHLGDRWRRLDVPSAAYNKGHLLDEFAAAHAADANATRPMTRLGDYMRDRFLPTAHLTPGAMTMGVDDAFSATQKALAAAMERKKALDEMSLAAQLGGSDYAKLGGASLLGSLGTGSGGR